MPSYSLDYLERLVAAVDRFERAFEDWAVTQNEATHLEARGLLPTAATRDGQDAAIVRKRELDLAEAAGAAARAVAVTGASQTIAGVGVIDPIANWQMMSAPRALFTPRDVRLTVATVRGRLRTLVDDAETAGDHPAPGFAPSGLHETIWTAAAAHWTTHQYRVAVREAAEALSLTWKTRLGRFDVDDTVFWQQTLSPGEPSAGRPKLTWPGDPTAKTGKGMRGGLAPLAAILRDVATGLNLTVRNVVTHSRTELSEQEAMERLSAYSYFARLLDHCEVRQFDASAARTADPHGSAEDRGS